LVFSSRSFCSKLVSKNNFFQVWRKKKSNPDFQIKLENKTLFRFSDKQISFSIRELFSEHGFEPFSPCFQFPPIRFQKAIFFRSGKKEVQPGFSNKT
jgi:hypothetical protein